MIRSSFSDLFGLQFPIMNAPMSGSAGAEIVSAVSNAGGLGMIGGSANPPGQSAATWLHDEIVRSRMLTKRPFGIGFISTRRDPETGRLTVEQLQPAALDAGATIIMHSFVVLPDLIADAHRRGVTVICQVQTVAMAREALDAGADVLIAQGYDGGGHVGSIGTMSIVPAVVDIAGDVPVLAAGGIADGRGLAAALMLGAQGASIGTRFYASAEATVPAHIQERVVSASTDDTVWTRSYDIVRDSDFGPTVGGRVVRNAFTDAWNDRPVEARASAAVLGAQIDAAQVARDISVIPVWAGTGVGLVRDVEPAGAIVRSICAAAEHVIRARSASLR